MKRLLSIGLIFACFLALAGCKDEVPKMKYVFYFIGDDMGVNQVNGTGGIVLGDSGQEVEMVKHLYSEDEPIISLGARILDDMARVKRVSGGHSAGVVPVYASRTIG